MVIHCLGRSTPPIHDFIAHCQKEANVMDEIKVNEITVGNSCNAIGLIN
jgi:hypothetical protein